MSKVKHHKCKNVSTHARNPFATSRNYKDFHLPIESELRLEVDSDTAVTLELMSGKAEIFGREIVLQVNYEFVRGSKVAIFTWHGCTLRLYDILTDEHAYISHETPLIIYMNVHVGLEQRRNSANKGKSFGPVCMIAGPPDVGKSTLTRLLLNYAVRMKKRRPIFVDLDVSDNSISLPGTVSSVVIEQPLPIEGYFPDTALVYNYGSTDVDSNPSLYKAILTKMACDIKKKAMAHKQTKMSGMVIDTMRYNRNKGIDHLVCAAEKFKVTIIFVLDCEKLRFLLMNNDYIKKQNVLVVDLPKSGGVVQLNQQIRFGLQDSRIREYFYGKHILVHPHIIKLKFSDVEIFKVGGPKIPDSCLPAGTVDEGSETKLCPVELSTNLLHYVFAMTYKHDPISSNVIGHVVVTSVNEELQTLSLLSTHPQLPRKRLIQTDIQYYDD